MFSAETDAISEAMEMITDCDNCIFGTCKTIELSCGKNKKKSKIKKAITLEKQKKRKKWKE